MEALSIIYLQLFGDSDELISAYWHKSRNKETDIKYVQADKAKAELTESQRLHEEALNAYDNLEKKFEALEKASRKFESEQGETIKRLRGLLERAVNRVSQQVLTDSHGNIYRKNAELVDEINRELEVKE